MPVSRLTAMVILTNDVIVTAGGPNADGKFMGWITHGPEKEYRPLLNTDARFDSAEDATAAAQAIVDDLESRRESLGLGLEASP